MTADNIIVLAILALSVLLFITDKVRVDVVALLVLVSLVLTDLLSPDQAFAGFASPAVITVWAVFIISGALFRSGVADWLAQTMLRLAGPNEIRLLFVIMLTVGLMSAFMNNIGAVAILLPAVVTISNQMKVPPSKLLMPLAFAALMGGNMTLIGTPPNILASSLLNDYAHVDSFAFFDFLPTGIIVLAAGIIYMLVLGRHLLPERTPGGDLPTAYTVRDYLTEVRVAEDSPLIGRTLTETQLGERFGLNILRVRPESGEPVLEVVGRPLQSGDVLLVEGPLPDILAVSRTLQLQPASEVPDPQRPPTIDDDTTKLAEVTLSPRSRLVGRTIKAIDFRARFGLSVLAIRHHGESIVTQLGDVPLQFGDALLVQGSPRRIDMLRSGNEFLVLDMPSIEMHRVDKAPFAVGILLMALAVVTFGLLNVSTTFLIAALLMVLTGVLSMDEAYEAIDWKSVFLIAGMLPLGTAMEITGTARLLANGLVDLVGGGGALVVLAGMFLLTALLTEVISNAAATVLMVPIAIDAALGLGADPRPFVMAVVIAASTSFLMPVGHQVNIIIFGPGGYKFTDYTRVGVGLNLLLLILMVIFLPIIWPLFPS